MTEWRRRNAGNLPPNYIKPHNRPRCLPAAGPANMANGCVIRTNTPVTSGQPLTFRAPSPLRFHVPGMVGRGTCAVRIG